MFYLIANNLALDLVNTRIFSGGKEVDLLASFGDLIEWLIAAGAIDLSEAEKAKEWEGTAKGTGMLRKALEFRESLRQIAEDLSNGRSVSSASLDSINDILKMQTGHFEVWSFGGKFEKLFRSEISPYEGLLVPVAESMADLLSKGDPDLVRQCENPECILYFYDTTKSHKRQWCSMAVCGNRAKAAAFYKRSKTTADKQTQIKTPGTSVPDAESL